MKIKNYTSEVPVSRTVSRIEELLSRFGAHNVSKDYYAGRLVAVRFSIRLETGREVSIRLPADESAVLKVLADGVRRPRQGTMERLKEQASRTAWKLQQDWVEVQLSLIEMQQAEAIQVFLPYVWDGSKTLFEAMRESGFKALPLQKESR